MKKYPLGIFAARSSPIFMNKTNQKKLLLVSYYLPPTKTVAVVRIFNFHLEAQKHFKEVFAMTTTNRRLFPKEHYDFDDKKTTEIWTYDLRRFFTKKNGLSAGVSAKKKSSRFAQFMSKLIYSFPFNIILDDGGLTYILGGFFKGKKIIREQNIEVLFSSYKPYSDHLICYLLKKWNPNLFWIADFRDLHVDEIRQNVLFPKIQKWFNRKILKKADVVTTVSKGLAKKIEELHSNVYVLRNGIPTVALAQENQTKKENVFFEKFTISYTGSIYPKLQNANLLFKVLKKLISENKIQEKHVQLIYAGKESQVWDSWIEAFYLQKINTTHGFLSKEKANEIQKRSHVNLLLSWSSENQQGILTAKFYEYLVARNPILLIINGSPDEEFEEIFKQLDAGEVIYDDPNFEKILEDFILEKYHEWVGNSEIKSSLQKSMLKNFTWKNQMNDFLKKLNENTFFEI